MRLLLITLLLGNLELIICDSNYLPCTSPSTQCDELIDTHVSAKIVNNDTKTTTEGNNYMCTLYMAESSIPNAGFGMYSAIDIPVGSKVGTGDIAIPIFDDELGSLINSYPWRGKDLGSHTQAEEVTNLCPGIEAIVNGHTSLMNIWANRVDTDECGLHRSTDPGVGAFTYSHNLQTIAIAPISAGMELFAEYGDHYFTSDDSNNKFINVPLSYDYVEADSILSKFDAFRKSKEGSITDESLEAFWIFFKENKAENHRVLSLLPNSLNGLKRAAEVGSAQFNAPRDLIRSTEWLETNGLCLDNLKEGKSTIAQAGRGAFASRYLKKGSFVAPMPLLHECKHNAFLSTYGRTQLLLNYCFGHGKSTLKFCPYGSFVSLINHNQTKANVEIRWSTSNLHKKEWLELGKDELCKIDHAGLIFDIIATRDILPGEEIFMNYGKEWEDAWINHEQNWKSPLHADQYKSASTINKEETIIRTVKEQKIDPYPDNVYLECFFRDGGEYEKHGDIFFQSYQGHESYMDLHRCQVLDRKISLEDTKSILYTVSMAYYNGYDKPYKTIVSNVPRNAIRFSDAPYTSDMFLDNVFRHEMLISDEIFPNAWKDLE